MVQAFKEKLGEETLLVRRIADLIDWSAVDLGCLEESAHQGPRQKLLGWQIIVGLVARCLHVQGGLEQVIRRYFGVSISSSALSQRRQKMQSEPFLTVMGHALKPMAELERHPSSFFGGYRLVGIDGSQFNLVNTAEINAEVRKTRTRRGDAAFAKLSMSTLVELGTHAPLAVAMEGGSLRESALSAQLWEALPPRSLLILDRLYGQAPFLQKLQRELPVKEGHFLVRVQERLKMKVCQTFEDGSAQVEITLKEAGKERDEDSLPAEKDSEPQLRKRGRPTSKSPSTISKLKVREVRGKIFSRSRQEWIDIRLWTSLSEQEAKAAELLKLYAKRWEQELFYKELKLGVNQGNLLKSQRLEMAFQQIAALMIACSLLAEERLAVADQAGGEIQQQAAIRISLSVCKEHIMALFLVLQAGKGLMNAGAQAELVRRVRQQIADFALPPRRSRSCQRKVRQPVGKWHRMFQPTSISSPLDFQVSPIA